MQGFDRARPLWEFTMVEGLADGRAALIAKIHHSITDGVGGMKLQMEMLDLERDPDERPEDQPLPPAPEAVDVTERQRWVDAVTYESRRQGDAARSSLSSALGTVRRLGSDPVGVGVDAVRTATSVGRMLRPTTEPMSTLMTERSLSVHFDVFRVPLKEMKAASKTVSGRLNDAFVGGVAGGFRRYHRHHGHDEVAALRMGMPINVRTEATATKAGNQFVPMRFAVPIDLDDPIAQMNAVRELVAKERAEPALALSDPLANLVNRLPATATTSLFGSMLRGVDFITSNVPGAPIPVFLGGAMLEAQIAFGPMSGAAANIVLVSYQDDLNIGVNTDPAAIPDPDVLYDYLVESFAEIATLA